MSSSGTASEHQSRSGGLHRRLLELVSEIVGVIGPDGRWRFVSPSVTPVLGWEVEEVVGARVTDFVVLHRHEDWDERFGTVNREPGRHGPFTIHIEAKDGGARRFGCTVVNRIDDPDVGGLVVVGRDETEKDQLNEQLIRSQAWSQTLIERGFELVLVIDRAGRIIYAPETVRPIIGHRPGALYGREVLDLVHPEDRALATEHLEELIDHGTSPIVLRLRVLHADGSVRHLDVFGADLLSEAAVRGVVLTAHDVTPMVEAEAGRRRTEARFRAFVQRSHDLVLVVDPGGSVSYASPAAKDMLGWTDQRLAGGVSIFDPLHPGDLARSRSELTRLATAPTGGRRPPIQVRVETVDGWRDVEVVASNLMDDPDVAGIVLNGRDVTDRRRAEDLVAEQSGLLERIALGLPVEETLAQLVDMVRRHGSGLAVALAILDDHGSLRLRWSRDIPDHVVAALDAETCEGLSAMLDAEEEVTTADPATEPAFAGCRETLLTWGVRSCWGAPLTATGQVRPMGVLVVFSTEDREPSPDTARVLDRARNLAGVALVREEFERRLEHQALHDELTGLPNRHLLIDRVAHAVARARHHHAAAALLFVDLDQFKRVNDGLGHETGDQLLREVARRFLDVAGPDHTVGRFGGDEFLVVCEQIDDEIEAVDLAGRLAAALDAPVTLDHREVVVSASIGIVLVDDAERDASDLIRDADAAMYRAKEQGRGRYVVFEAELHQRVVERLELERELRAAIDQDDLEVWYQPTLRLADRAVVGAEALVRWTRHGGPALPDEFVPVAEETGLVVAMDRLVRRRVCADIAAFAAAGLPPLQVSMNLSARDLSTPGLVDEVAELIRAHDLDPRALAFEVTERTIAADLDAAARVLAELGALGVTLAIDDFGTGYASLEYLRAFDMVHQLKIDRSFVADLDEAPSRKNQAIVAASLVLARDLGFTSVAEGVETDTQRVVLTALGCELAQGFLFCAPVPGDRFAAWIEEWSGTDARRGYPAGATAPAAGDPASSTDTPRGAVARWRSRR